MLNEYNYKLLKEDIKNGKQIILFLGAGVNYCKNHRILWADVMAHLFGHALMSISCDKNIDDDDLVLLKRLFNIPSDNGGALDVSLSLDLHKYVQDEYPSVLQAYIVKKILGGRYISIIQDFLYTHCNAELIKNAFEANHVMGQKPTAMDDDYACLFEVARLILLCPNIKAVVTYNYDNFLTKAIEVLQSEPDKYFSAEELKLFERRVSGDMEVVDIYGDDYDRAFKSTTFPVYHVHGYIPDRNEFQTIDDTSIVLSLDEFYDNVRNVYSWQTDTQMHLLSHYTCIFLGTSISDITIQRMLYYAQHYGNKENIYCFRASDTISDEDNQESRLHKILTEIKNDFYRDYGLTIICREGGYPKMYSSISKLVDPLID